MLPTAEKALLRPLARLPIPAVAAKAIRARISRYSTRPCPASSLRRRSSELKNIFVITNSPLAKDVRLRSRGARFGAPRTESELQLELCDVLAQHAADGRECAVKA